jgi:hypothetical protein
VPEPNIWCGRSLNVVLWTVSVAARLSIRICSKKALMQTEMAQLKGIGIVLKPDSAICCPAS